MNTPKVPRYASETDEQSFIPPPPPPYVEPTRLAKRLLPASLKNIPQSDYVFCPVQTSTEHTPLCMGQRCAAFRQSSYADFGYCKIIDSEGGK